MTAWTLEEAVEYTSQYDHVALDVDGVIASFVDCFRMTYQEISGSVGFEFSQLTKWNIGESIKIDRDLENRIWKSEELLNHMKVAPVLISGKRFVSALDAKGVKITYITARGADDLTLSGGDYHKILLEKWLETNSFPHGEIILELSKIPKLKELGIAILVDDSPSTAQSGSENGIEIILPDWPWNQEVEHELIKRVKW